MSATQAMPAVPRAAIIPGPPTTNAERWPALLEAVAAGDREAMGAFYDESVPLTYSLIMRVLQDRDAAEDAVVDLYADVQARASRGEHRDRHPVSWIIELARHAARARRHAASISDTARLASVALSRGSVVAFHAPHRQPGSDAMFAMLTDVQRSIVQLTFFGGLTAREAAQQLSMPREIVARELHTALCTLRTATASGELWREHTAQQVRELLS